MLFFLKEGYEKVVKAFGEGLRVDSSKSKIYNNLALALYKLGKYEEAHLAFKKGGDEATPYYNMGCLYMKDRKYKEAVYAFEKAIELN